MKKSTCRHCKQPIELKADSLWHDNLVQSAVCYAAISLRHAPVIEAISDRFGMEGRYDR